MLIHMGQKPDRFDFHVANAEITFQEMQKDILVSFIFKWYLGGAWGRRERQTASQCTEVSIELWVKCVTCV